MQNLLLIFLLIFPWGLSAQVDALMRDDSFIARDTATADTTGPWITGGFAAFSLSQVSLTNWSAGGEDALSVLGVLNLFANYKREKTAWENTLDLGYGLLQSNKNPMRKNEDKIDFNSKFGKLATGKFYYSGLLNFKSQFANGYNYPNDSVIISHFGAPAYVTVAAGMDYKPNRFFSLFLAPAAGRFTLVNNRRLADMGAFGVGAAVYDTVTGLKLQPGKKFRAEFGAYLRMHFQKDVIKNVNVKSTLNLFNNYTDKNKKNRQNIDINWESMINIKAGKYLTTTIFAHLIYDDDIDLPTFEEVNGVETQVGQGPKVQFKESIGVGLSYKF